MGAKMEDQTARLFAIIGDGGFQMTVQIELSN
jgi:thiamine pyrophosphate-dependent acetolactate synthase large subunit-like protein